MQVFKDGGEGNQKLISSAGTRGLENKRRTMESWYCGRWNILRPTWRILGVFLMLMGAFLSHLTHL